MNEVADEATEEIGVEENAPPERPDWLPSNFQSPEDLAKSYSHATSKITEQGQELAAMRSQLEEIQASQFNQQQQVSVSDVEQELYDAYESGDGRAIARANAYLMSLNNEALKKDILAALPQTPQNTTEIVALYATDKMRERHDDWAEMEPKVREVVGSNPVLQQMISNETSPTKVAEYLETALVLARADMPESTQSQAQRALDELNRQAKNSAQTMSGSNSSEEDASYFDKVKEARSGIPPIRL